MGNYIVTISREFGCNAREIARRLASRLNIPIYDKDLVDLTAEKAGLHRDIIAESDETADPKQNRLFNHFGYGSTTSFFSEEAIKAQAAVICEIANKKNSCIMFGRCSDYILREYPNVLNFFLYAPLQNRVKHIAKTYQITERNAEKMIKRIDKQRHNYYKYVTGKNRGDREGKLLMLDVSAYGIEKSAELLCEVIRIRLSLENDQAT
ncbi:MAG: cytidylate kinase-like family protein [Oscillospiraceae bacterium]|nr:cytidylate kinase-like family protein [Oscillospiraceae bacterium]